MKDADFSAEFCVFIQSAIPSYEAAELLLLLARTADRHWSSPEAVAELEAETERLTAAAVFALGASAAAVGIASAADVTYASYDFSRDELIVDVVYRGTTPDHDFSLGWSRCSGDMPHQIVALIIDQQWREPAHKEYRARERFSLADMPCRPALVTVRTGGVGFTTFYVPSR